MNISHRLTLGFFAMAILVGVIGYMGYLQIDRIGDRMNTVARRETPAALKLSAMHITMLDGARQSLAYLLLGAAREQEEFYESMFQFDRLADEFEAIADLDNLEQKEEANLYREILESKSRFVSFVNELFDSYDTDAQIDLESLRLYEEEIHELASLIGGFVEIEIKEVEESNEEARNAVAFSKSTLPETTLFAFAVALAIVLVISRSISRPLSNLTRAAAEISNGHLGARVGNIKGKGELSELSMTFNYMASALEDSYRQLEQRVNETEKAKSSLESEIVERKEVEAQLSRSNQELEQFAHIASHDLQEPLRMVSSYTQLLERRYKDKLDSDANEFIGYAVDGAKRMQTQINDLLAYSRVTTQGNSFEPTNCSDIFENAVANLAAGIEESGAVVTRDSLPTLPADASQLVSVFQNLIGNSIKYHGDQPPRMHVSAVESGDEWLFSFEDNGIGIESEFSERIFQIFQRLHSKAKYAGTGIGLAICKKVIERHGGHIWVESEPQKGSTFYFTLPMRKSQEEDHGGSGYHEGQTNRDLVGGRQSG